MTYQSIFRSDLFTIDGGSSLNSAFWRMVPHQNSAKFNGFMLAKEPAYLQD